MSDHQQCTDLYTKKEEVKSITTENTLCFIVRFFYFFIGNSAVLVFAVWPRSCEWATQLHSPRPLPKHVHSIMCPMISWRLSHLSPTRCIIPSLVVHNSSWATEIREGKKWNQILCVLAVSCFLHLCICMLLRVLSQGILLGPASQVLRSCM